MPVPVLTIILRHRLMSSYGIIRYFRIGIHKAEERGGFTMGKTENINVFQDTMTEFGNLSIIQLLDRN